MNVSTTPYQNARLLIDGEWIESQTTEWHDIVNPATQQVLAKVPSPPPMKSTPPLLLRNAPSRPGS